jgi:hypothetical protein
MSFKGKCQIPVPPKKKKRERENVGENGDEAIFPEVVFDHLIKSLKDNTSSDPPSITKPIRITPNEITLTFILEDHKIPKNKEEKHDSLMTSS